MGFNMASDTYEHYYNGQEIKILWNRQNYSLDEYYDEDSIIDRIQFDYKGIEVIEFCKSKRCEWYKVANKVCKIIDKLGADGYNTYKKYHEIMDDIKDKYIIVNELVYKPEIGKNKIDRYVIYNMFIGLEDDVNVNGASNSRLDELETDFAKKDRCSFSKTLKNLQNNLNSYIKENNVNPKDSYIDEKMTIKYKEILDWCKENNLEGIFNEL